MSTDKTEILVYADWIWLKAPKLMGMLTAEPLRGKMTFSFEFEKEWLNSNKSILLDPDLQWFSGRQFPVGKDIFGIFSDSMPDTWGRTLMKRRAALVTKNEKTKPRNLNDLDFLLGVYDESRMGALRFKLSVSGSFLDDSTEYPTPPWTSIRELQFAAKAIESNSVGDDLKKWLAFLMAPGSSLGGARPKANIMDSDGQLWIAKFPSKNDTIDKAKWEYLAYKLALSCGIEMAESKIENVSGNFHTFFTKRFDREKLGRVHFTSAMTMTGNNESTIKDNAPSYLEIAEFIQFSGALPKVDLHQLWLRIVFSITISNTDDHLRNHGFILTQQGWRLSPAYDINPSIDKDGLALNIDEFSNELDFDLAKSVGQYFQLSDFQMNDIIKIVKSKVSLWKSVAKEIGISRTEQELMSSAFQNFKSKKPPQNELRRLPVK